jgi:ParB family chromosome partitioning protein
MVCVTRVCAADLDASGDHLFWSEKPSPAMRTSIASVGQLEPVLARPQGGRWHVISGYKRVYALKEAGVDVMVREVPGAADPLVDGLLYLHANIQRILDDGMRLRALRYFQAWMGPEDLAGRIAPLLGLEPRSGIWRRLMDWLKLPPTWDAILYTGYVPLCVGSILAGLSLTALDALRPYFEGLKWSHSRAVQWLTFLVETARREGIDLEELLERCDARAVLAGDYSPQDKLQRLCAQAKILRYPTLTAMERQFQILRKELAGDSHWELAPNEGFEADVVELRLRARNAAQIQAAVPALERLAGSGSLSELFKIASP